MKRKSKSPDQPTLFSDTPEPAPEPAETAPAEPQRRKPGRPRNPPGVPNRHKKQRTLQLEPYIDAKLVEWTQKLGISINLLFTDALYHYFKRLEKKYPDKK